jgi:molecular chaperone GrpE (heat shock protein)
MKSEQNEWIKCNKLNALQSQEIIALKERIKRLEENLMDMKNKHAALVADVALYEDRGERIKRLEELGNELRDCASRIGTVAADEASVIRRTQKAIEEWNNKTK